jgi:hypothetical protein|tara:strand:- start:1403 stop:1654 length:252 start_codon:yes stop_codon:yes gene_type:complete
MKLKLMLMSSFCFFLVSCGGGGGDDVYDEYHDLMCKAASGLDGSMSMAEAMDLNKKVAEFAENNADKMTDLKKTAEAMDITRC